MDNIIPLRPVDRKRLDSLQERVENPLTADNIGYVHTVFSQCFLPYRDPKTPHWKRKNGNYSILLTAGILDDPSDPTEIVQLGLPYGAKPRLFQSYVCTRAIKQQSRVIPVAHSMTKMIHELGFAATGGKPFQASRSKLHDLPDAGSILSLRYRRENSATSKPSLSKVLKYGLLQMPTNTASGPLKLFSPSNFMKTSKNMRFPTTSGRWRQFRTSRAPSTLIYG
jgi:hypothetical protein